MMTACFTGHRKISPEIRSELAARIDKTVEEVYAQGYCCFLCGGALGFDTMAALAVLRARDKHADIRLHLALPCKEQAARWKACNLRVYNEIRDKADRVDVLSDRYYAGCMQMRNRFMVEHSSLCICYWNEPHGGTAFTVRYAASRRLDIINLALPEALMREKACSYTFISPSAPANAFTAPLRLKSGRNLKQKKTSD